jgi:hypothetical protein
MTTWVKQHFRDEQQARETLAIGVILLAVVGLGVVTIGLMLSR